MGAIVILLTVGFVPTANFDWSDVHEVPQGARPADYAVCFFNVKQESAEAARASAIFSILLVTLAYAIRVVLAHEYLSRMTARHLRNLVSTKLRSGLSILRGPAPEVDSWRRRILYHPCLALFLFGRISVDILVSMFVEVRNSFPLGVMLIDII